MREFIIEIYNYDCEVYVYLITTDVEENALKMAVNKFTYTHTRSDIDKIVVRVA